MSRAVVVLSAGELKEKVIRVLGEYDHKLMFKTLSVVMKLEDEAKRNPQVRDILRRIEKLIDDLKHEKESGRGSWPWLFEPGWRPAAELEIVTGIVNEALALLSADDLVAALEAVRTWKFELLRALYLLVSSARRSREIRATVLRVFSRRASALLLADSLAELLRTIDELVAVLEGGDEVAGATDRLLKWLASEKKMLAEQVIRGILTFVRAVRTRASRRPVSAASVVRCLDSLTSRAELIRRLYEQAKGRATKLRAVRIATRLLLVSEMIGTPRDVVERLVSMASSSGLPQTALEILTWSLVAILRSAQFYDLLTELGERGRREFLPNLCKLISDATLAVLRTGDALVIHEFSREVRRVSFLQSLARVALDASLLNAGVSADVRLLRAGEAMDIVTGEGESVRVIMILGECTADIERRGRRHQRVLVGSLTVPPNARCRLRVREGLSRACFIVARLTRSSGINNSYPF